MRPSGTLRNAEPSDFQQKPTEPVEGETISGAGNLFRVNSSQHSFKTCLLEMSIGTQCLCEIVLPHDYE